MVRAPYGKQAQFRTPTASPECGPSCLSGNAHCRTVGNPGFKAGEPNASHIHTADRMMETATTAGTTTRSTYDSDWLRVTDTDPTTNLYVHHLESQLLVNYEEQQGVATWQVAYLYLGSRLLGAMRPAAAPPGTVRLTVAARLRPSGFGAADGVGHGDRLGDVESRGVRLPRHL